MQDERTEPQQLAPPQTTGPQEARPHPASPDALWQRYRRDRDPEALDALVRRYAHLAASIAGGMARACPPSIDRDDLYAAALVGLAAAVRTHDPGRGPWQGWAKLHIRRAVVDYLRTLQPRGQRHAAQLAHQAVAQLAHRLGHWPNEEELADEVGPALARAAAQAPAASLDTPVGRKPDDPVTLADTIEAPAQTDPIAILEEAGPDVAPIDLALLYLRHVAGLSLNEIARLYRLTPSAIHARLKKARAQLRDTLDPQAAAEALP